MRDDASERLCAECGAPLDASPACASCGARRATTAATPGLPEGPAVDAAWAGVARATLVFLVVNLALRLPQIVDGGPSVGRAVVAAAATAAVVLGVHRGLARRNAALLVAWSWLVPLGAVSGLAGVALWASLASAPRRDLALAVAASLSAAAYAAWLLVARRTIEGRATPGA